MITSATDVRAPGRLRRIAPALGTALVVALAAGYVWAVDPNAGGTYPVCPTQALLGVDCPACGGLRGTHSLLHGDLWGGNAAFLPDGEPVLFDPASYYGDRETDLAFTRLFGGFAPTFYRRYRELMPAPEPVRESIYNLYHLLNHDHLFGGGYGEQSATLMRGILREIG